MSRLNKSAFLASASFSLEHERSKARAFSQKHADTLSGIRNSLKASKPVAGSKIVRLAMPVWVMLGSTSLEAGLDVDPVKTETYVNEELMTFSSAFSLSYGAAEDGMVNRMMTALCIGLPEIALLLAEAETLARAGAGKTHPRLPEIAAELPEFVLGLQHAMVAAALGRIVDERDLRLIPDERPVFFPSLRSDDPRR